MGRAATNFVVPSEYASWLRLKARMGSCASLWDLSKNRLPSGERPLVRRDARAIAALDDLARELSLYLQRTSSSDPLTEDPRGSLCGALTGLETSFPQPAQAASRKGSSPDGEAVNALPAQQRELLALHLGQGLTCLEIAERTQRAREAVLLDLVRAYGHLRLQLGGEGLSSIYGRAGRA